MRSDMTKVLVETRRHGGRGLIHKPRRAGEDYENYPTQEGLRRAWKDRKELSDNLSPLYGYLERQVGRPWDLVWSEMCEHLDLRSALGFHVKSHLDQYVQKHARIIDGRPHEISPGAGWQPMRPTELYVHPTTGLLCRVKGTRRWARYRKPVDPTKRTLPDGRTLEQIAGIWYAVTYHQVWRVHDKTEYNLMTRRVERREAWAWEPAIQAKRQLSTRELRDLGLTNTPTLDNGNGI